MIYEHEKSSIVQSKPILQILPDKQLPVKATENRNVTIQMVSILNNDGTHRLLFITT